jgi:regulator of sigma E protease
VDLLISTILPFLGVLVVLVVVHEAGHFFTAKLFGVRVLEFGVGYPPRLFVWKKGETEYTINALPLGGFVRLQDEMDPAEQTQDEENGAYQDATEDPRSFVAQKPWKRLIIMGAGAFMNLVLAIFLFSAALMIPREVSVGNAMIAQVVPGSPAEHAGLKVGDIIEKIDGRPIDSVPDASYNIRLNLGEDTPITVRRIDKITGATSTETVHVTPRWAPPPFEYVVQPGDDVNIVAQRTTYDTDAVRQAAGIEFQLPADKQLVIGTGDEAIYYTTQKGDTVGIVATLLRVSENEVATAAGLPDPTTLQPGTTLLFTQGATGIRIGAQYPYTETRSDGPITAVQKGWRNAWDSLKLARNGIYAWIKGGESAPVTGPIGIAQATGEIVKEAGWKSLMETAALLSMNLAVLNILPLPFVDGGKMTFVVIEILRRGKRIAPNKEAMVHLVGMAALLILVVVLSYFDVARIVRGDELLR